jgi:hypothetical protein
MSPSPEIASWLPTGRGAEPQVSTTVASTAPRPRGARPAAGTSRRQDRHGTPAPSETARSAGCPWASGPPARTRATKAGSKGWKVRRMGGLLVRVGPCCPRRVRPATRFLRVQTAPSIAISRAFSPASRSAEIASASASSEAML